MTEKKLTRVKYEDIVDHDMYSFSTIYDSCAPLRCTGCEIKRWAALYEECYEWKDMIVLKEDSHD